MAKKKPAKPLGKASMKKTKGGILIGLKPPPPLNLAPKLAPPGNQIPPTPCI